MIAQPGDKKFPLLSMNRLNILMFVVFGGFQISFYIYLQSAKWNIGTGVGSIVSVDATGWVQVSWDLGFKTREKAGAGGEYWVQLL